MKLFLKKGKSFLKENIILNSSGVAKAMLKKLEKNNICLIDYKTDEKIAIPYELKILIKSYYKKELGE